MQLLITQSLTCNLATWQSARKSESNQKLSKIYLNKSKILSYAFLVEYKANKGENLVILPLCQTTYKDSRFVMNTVLPAQVFSALQTIDSSVNDVR